VSAIQCLYFLSLAVSATKCGSERCSLCAQSNDRNSGPRRVDEQAGGEDLGCDAIVASRERLMFSNRGRDTVGLNSTAEREN